MFKGVVKWFNDAKGYGFIVSELNKEDLFVHFSAIIMQGFKTLKEGQKVEYDINVNNKGKHVFNVRVLKD